MWRVFNWACQAGRRVCWAPRDLSIFLHFNCFENKLCKLPILRVLVAAWTFRDFCLAYFCLHWDLLQSWKVIKDVGKNIPQRSSTPHTYIHTASACLDMAYSLTRETKACDTFWCFAFFPPSSRIVLSAAAIFQVISIFSAACARVCSILEHQPKDWISH